MLSKTNKLALSQFGLFLISSTLGIIVILCLVGCQKPVDVPELESTKYIRCIDGVEYVVFKEYSGYNGYGYMSVKFNMDGSVSLCSGD